MSSTKMSITWSNLLFRQYY